jgi:hypothetical protein
MLPADYTEVKPKITKETKTEFFTEGNEVNEGLRPNDPPGGEEKRNQNRRKQS